MDDVKRKYRFRLYYPSQFLHYFFILSKHFLLAKFPHLLKFFQPLGFYFLLGVFLVLWPCAFSILTGLCVRSRARKTRNLRIRNAYGNGRYDEAAAAALGVRRDPEAPSPPPVLRQANLSRMERARRGVSRSWAYLAAQRVSDQLRARRAQEADLTGRERARQATNRFDDLPRLSNEEIALARLSHQRAADRTSPPPPPPPPHRSANDGVYENMTVRVEVKPEVLQKRKLPLPKVIFFYSSLEFCILSSKVVYLF